jgi:hypothetical protein
MAKGQRKLHKIIQFLSLYDSQEDKIKFPALSQKKAAKKYKFLYNL